MMNLPDKIGMMKMKLESLNNNNLKNDTLELVNIYWSSIIPFI